MIFHDGDDDHMTHDDMGGGDGAAAAGSGNGDHGDGNGEGGETHEDQAPAA